jgi:cytochrome bd-type quinol oxidase subunit 2
MSAYVKARLVTLVCYTGAIFLVLHNNAYGHLSDRADTTALVVATFSFFLLVVLFSVLEHRARKTAPSAAVGPIDEASRNRRERWTRVRIILYKLRIAILLALLLLVIGGIRRLPWLESLPVVIVALAWTAWSIWRVTRLKKTLRQGG